MGPRAVYKLRCLTCGHATDGDSVRKQRKLWFRALVSIPSVMRYLSSLPPTKFVGYDTLECTTTVTGLIVYAPTRR